MEWYRGELKTHVVGEFLGVRVLVGWGPAPWDSDWPWRWAVLLQGGTLDRDTPPPTWARIVASWNAARTEAEARSKAEAKALTLLRALPREWTAIEGEDPLLPF